MNLIDIAIAILNIKGSDYRCIISLINKNEAINLIQNADLNEKSRSSIKNIYKNESLYKNGKNNYKI